MNAEKRAPEKSIAMSASINDTDGMTICVDWFSRSSAVDDPTAAENMSNCNDDKLKLKDCVESFTLETDVYVW